METKKQVASPAMIAYGLRRLPPTPLPSTIGRTGKTQGEIAVISPATKASGIATTTIRPLFGRVCLLGCYRFLICGFRRRFGSLGLRVRVRGGGRSALLLAAPAAPRAPRRLGLR